ncbi:hypothetical protein N658DRAFT_513717 [Parathielavia hyrcaniae]|uniref:Uncharacterized protein n=1 Tax=Parathielavia hyrcaniae TaxID=113614 RepID=A0AAN6Q7A7_9PEZI|nr:hypothetical protein N658DRAFT_513717 [Parathielavia hyrcaniae]
MSSTPNLGPATEPFTPPESCLKITTYRAQYKGTPIGFTLGTDPDCFPPPTSAPATSATHLLRLYSPGICPVGYEYVMPYTRSVTGQNYDDSVTRYICCPDDLPAYTSIRTFWDGACVTVTAHPILVAWQDKDKEVLAALAERDWQPFWPPAWEAEKATTKRMEILLAVLVPVGVIFLTVAAWAYWLKRNRRLHRGQMWPRCLGGGKHATQQDTEESGCVRCGRPELPADPRSPSHLENHPAVLVAHELHTEPIPIREADSRRVVPEADSTPLWS